MEYYGLNIIKYEELGWASLLPDNHNDPVIVGWVVDKFVNSTELVVLLLINRDPVTTKLPVTSKDPETGCDPVKYLKLLSNSSIVKAEPFPSEPVLNVNAILFYFLFYYKYITLSYPADIFNVLLSFHNLPATDGSDVGKFVKSTEAPSICRLLKLPVALPLILPDI